MKSYLVASFFAISFLIISSNALASRVTTGPFVDFNDLVLPNPARGPVTAQTLHLVNLHSTAIPNFPYYAIVPPATPCSPNQAPGCVLFPFYDAVIFGGIDFPERIAGIAFHTTDDTDPTSDLRITTIYGINLNANNGTIELNGVSATSPEFLAHDERFIGATGSVYFANDVKILDLEEVRTYLGVGFDLSLLQGDPHRNFYVFDTTIPGADLSTFLAPVTVPGPASWLLMASAIGVFGARVLRRREKNVGKLLVNQLRVKTS